MMGDMMKPLWVSASVTWGVIMNYQVFIIQSLWYFYGTFLYSSLFFVFFSSVLCPCLKVYERVLQTSLGYKCCLWHWLHAMYVTVFLAIVILLIEASNQKMPTGWFWKTETKDPFRSFNLFPREQKWNAEFIPVTGVAALKQCCFSET